MVVPFIIVNAFYSFGGLFLCLIELCFELLKILPCEDLMWDVCFWYLIWIVFAKENLKQWTMHLEYTFLFMQLWWMVNSQLWISWWSHYIKKNEWINWFLANVCCKEHNGVFGSFVEKCLPCLLCMSYTE